MLIFEDSVSKMGDHRNEKKECIKRKCTIIYCNKPYCTEKAALNTLN